MSETLVVTEVVNTVVVTPVENTVEVASVGVQGPAGATGATGATGASGVVSVTAPITNSGTSTSANIGVSAGSTSTAGVLQLTDSTSSTSTTTAATPNAVKTAYDLRNPLVKRQTGQYFSSPNYITTAAMTATNQRAYYTVVYIDQTTTIDRIAMRTSTLFSGTGSVRLGIYNHDYSTGLPSTLLLDAGTVSPTATSTVYQITISQTLNAGFYWVVMCQQGTAPTTGSYLANSVGSTFNQYLQILTTPGGNQNIAYIENSISGAFVDAGTLSLSAQAPYVWLRVG
jgi:hypothetical protein